MAGNQQEKPRGNEQRQTGFPSAPADSNVFPPGAPQNSQGSDTGPVDAGTPATVDHGRNKQAGIAGSATGGNPDKPKE